jgi:hypothetical protein
VRVWASLTGSNMQDLINNISYIAANYLRPLVVNIIPAASYIISNGTFLDVLLVPDILR